MFALGFLGFWFRLVFEFRFNLKEKERASQVDYDSEKYKDIKAGTLVFGILVITAIMVFFLK